MPSCSGRTSRSASAGRCSRPRRLAAKSAAQAEIVGKSALAQVIVGHVDGRRVARKVVRVCHFSCDLAAVKMAQDDLKRFKTLTLAGGHRNIVHAIVMEMLGPSLLNMLRFPGVAPFAI
ncbi:unnamed protein product [Effrenium voratum]|uniref:Uncharacterized protein n=1 Tax=Effrenium voratum TaxID=2562239 RepID=A0AA36HZF4_9DINO|nr:unnamed protein product [Effrenium voratum]